MKIYNDEDIKQIAPAVFATAPDRNRVSEKYSFASTIEAVNALRDSGWEVTGVESDKPRLRNPLGVRHTLTLARREDIAKGASNLYGDSGRDVLPTIYLRNSHNGRTKLMARAGLYRVVCANGLIVGDDFATYVARHIMKPAEWILEVVDDVTKRIEPVAERLELLKTTRLDRDAQEVLALHGLALRTESQAVLEDRDVLKSLLEAKRDEDKGDETWRVYNRVQEHVVSEPLKAFVGTGDNRRLIHSPAPRDIRRREALNTELWNAAVALAEAA